MGNRVKVRVLQSCHPHHIHFHERLKRVFQTILRGLRFKGNTESFLAGRMSYTFDRQFDMSRVDTPTVVFRSKEDCPVPKDGLVLQSHSKLLNGLSSVLEWHAQNRKRQRHERLARRPGATSLPTANTTKITADDVEMFEGGYATKAQADEARNVQRSDADMIRDGDEAMDVADNDEKGTAESVAIASAAEFQKKYEEYQNELAAAAAPGGGVRAPADTQDPADKGLLSVYKRDDKASLGKRGGTEDKREREPGFVSSCYMECYPAGFGNETGYEVYEDSDEDEDKSKMDMGRLKQFGAKRRQDFANEEDWEAYQSKKEALPKAAFQYGRKVDDNRVTRRNKKQQKEKGDPAGV
eukprot:GHVQ01000183.1.p1 GENE.GHVQ01000183.1~~GHVQ01000183.1.p1  ORF type:complete len:354 (-),score=59.48 GHVQ01000183.1:138-1199(-)